MDIEMQRKEYPQAASSAIAQGIENLKKKKKRLSVLLLVKDVWQVELSKIYRM